MTNLDFAPDFPAEGRVQTWRSWGLGYALVALLLVASTLLFARQRLVTARMDFTQTLKAIDTLQLVETRALAAENGVRDYLLTGQRESLAPLAKAREDIPRFLDILAELLVDEPRHTVAVQQLRAISTMELDTLHALAAADDPAPLLADSSAHFRLLRREVESLQALLDATLIADYALLQGAERLGLGVAGLVALVGLGGAWLAIFIGWKGPRDGRL